MEVRRETNIWSSQFALKKKLRGGQIYTQPVPDLDSHWCFIGLEKGSVVLCLRWDYLSVVLNVVSVNEMVV